MPHQPAFPDAAPKPLGFENRAKAQSPFIKLRTFALKTPNPPGLIGNLPRHILPLDIEGVHIERVCFTADGDIRIHVIGTVEGSLCHRCGRELKLGHLSILDQPTYYSSNHAGYICRDCAGNPTTTQRLSWYDARYQTTKAHADHVLKQLINNTVSDVSRKE
jgi:hypothetical protein